MHEILFFIDGIAYQIKLRHFSKETLNASLSLDFLGCNIRQIYMLSTLDFIESFIFSYTRIVSPNILYSLRFIRTSINVAKCYIVRGFCDLR